MPDTATVALVTGGPLLTNKTGFGNETPWSRRPKVTLSVEDGETLASALTRAGAEMDVELDGGYRLPQTLNYVAFFTPDDEAGLTRRYLYASNLPLVNEPGLVTWRNSIHDATFSQLARAAALGALEGDPYRPYLILQQPAGNGVLADWATVEAVWDAFNYVMAHLDTIGGGVLTLTAAKRLVIDRLARKGRDAKDVIRRRGTSWSARGGTPYEMAEWLGDRAWSSATLARLLDCSEPEAKALLWAFGFARTKTGVWEKDVDEGCSTRWCGWDSG